MTHDEMCPLGYALDHLEQHDEECGWDPDNCTHYCQCVLIRKVRDAQREQDAGIVESLMPSTPTLAGDEMYEHLDGRWIEQELTAKAIRDQR